MKLKGPCGCAWWVKGAEIVDSAHSGRHACGAKCDRKCTKDHNGREGHGVREGGHACT